MSNDNVAVLTTLNGAVLLIGSVQYTKLLQKTYRSTSEIQGQRLAKRAALMDAKRRGEELAIDDLLALQPSQMRRKLLKVLPALLASFVWFALCFQILGSQLLMLEWIGTANAGSDPALAERSFRVTAISIVVLVAEGYFATVAGFVVKARRAKRSHRALYTLDERVHLYNAVRAARPLTPAPTPSPPTGSPGRVA